MRLPGFTAEYSTMRRGSTVHPAQNWFDIDRPKPNPKRTGSKPIYFPPDTCPPGYQPTQVQTGGEQICLRWVEGACKNAGTPFEQCWPARCINWQTTNVETHWECQPRLFTVGE